MKEQSWQEWGRGMNQATEDLRLALLEAFGPQIEALRSFVSGIMDVLDQIPSPDLGLRLPLNRGRRRTTHDRTGPRNQPIGRKRSGWWRSTRSRTGPRNTR